MVVFCLIIKFFVVVMKPPWRNRLARSAVNRKVGGSSPPGGANDFALKEFAFNLNI